MKQFAIAALLALQAAVAQAALPANLPGWLAGSWETNEARKWTDELWSAPKGDIMLGTSRSGIGERLRSWEMMRIERKPDGSLSFYGQPRGAPAVEFTLVRADRNSIEFANPAHDYPQRIRYTRLGPLLIAEISKLDGSDAVRWSYRAAAAAVTARRARPSQ